MIDSCTVRLGGTDTGVVRVLSGSLEPLNGQLLDERRGTGPEGWSYIPERALLARSCKRATCAWTSWMFCLNTSGEYGSGPWWRLCSCAGCGKRACWGGKLENPDCILAEVGLLVFGCGVGSKQAQITSSRSSACQTIDREKGRGMRWTASMR